MDRGKSGYLPKGDRAIVGGAGQLRTIRSERQSVDRIPMSNGFVEERSGLGIQPAEPAPEVSGHEQMSIR